MPDPLCNYAIINTKDKQLNDPTTSFSPGYGGLIKEVVG